jgi:hypothetical protein
MIAALQPVEQVLFIFRQFDAGDADGLKPSSTPHALIRAAS